MSDHTWDAMLKSSLPIRLNCLVCFYTRYIANRKRVVHAYTTTGSLLHQINFGNMWTQHGLLYSKDTTNASLILRRGAGVTATSGGYTNY
ncbi:hypothetical protein TNCV_2437731 [Trichonephila clavipes]|nr:hypothetical protein TNCV_2437731 [Trichonephila clavipes]